MNGKNALGGRPEGRRSFALPQRLLSRCFTRSSCIFSNFTDQACRASSQRKPLLPSNAVFQAGGAARRRPARKQRLQQEESHAGRPHARNQHGVEKAAAAAAKAAKQRGRLSSTDGGQAGVQGVGLGARAAVAGCCAAASAPSSDALVSGVQHLSGALEWYLSMYGIE